MVDCSTISQVECVLENNNLFTYKLIVLGLIFIYALYINYKYQGHNFIELKKDKSNFDYLKDIVSFIAAKIYLYSIPLTLILLRTEITFEQFLKYIAVGYSLFFIVFLGLALLFLEKFTFRTFFSKSNNSNFRERIKYGQK